MKNLFYILFVFLFIFSCSKNNKVLDGTITSYYENNTIKEIKTYVNGKVEVCFIDLNTKKPKKFPDDLLLIFK